MTGLSRNLKVAFVCAVALGGGSMAYNRSIEAEQFPEPAFPLPMADIDQSTPTTWLAPPITRNPFAPVDGLIIDQAVSVGPTSGGSVDSSSAETDSQPQGGEGAPTTTVNQPPTTLDDRPIGEVVDSRLPTTTTTTQADLAGS